MAMKICHYMKCHLKTFPIKRTFKCDTYMASNKDVDILSNNIAYFQGRVFTYMHLTNIPAPVLMNLSINGTI